MGTSGRDEVGDAGARVAPALAPPLTAGGPEVGAGFGAMAGRIITANSNSAIAPTAAQIQGGGPPRAGAGVGMEGVINGCDTTVVGV